MGVGLLPCSPIRENPVLLIQNVHPSLLPLIFSKVPPTGGSPHLYAFKSIYIYTIIYIIYILYFCLTYQLAFIMFLIIIIIIFFVTVGILNMDTEQSCSIFRIYGGMEWYSYSIVCVLFSMPFLFILF